MTDSLSHIASAKDADTQLKHLVVSFHKDIVAFANKILVDPYQSEDVVQEAYIRFQKKKQFDCSGEVSAKSYLYRIVRNLAIDCLRRKKFEQALFPLSSSDSFVVDCVAENRSTLEERIIATEELVRILAGLDTLPERTRIAFEMHRFGGYTMQQIAERLKISKSTATRLVADGLVMCRRCRNQ